MVDGLKKATNAYEYIFFLIDTIYDKVCRANYIFNIFNVEVRFYLVVGLLSLFA